MALTDESLKEALQAAKDFGDGMREAGSAWSDEDIFKTTKAVNDLSQKFKPALQKILDEMANSDKVMEEMAKQTALNMQKGFSDYFFDIIHLKINSLSDFIGNTFDVIRDTIIRAFADVLASDVVREFFGLFSGLASGAGFTGLGGWLKGLVASGGSGQGGTSPTTLIGSGGTLAKVGFWINDKLGFSSTAAAPAASAVTPAAYDTLGVGLSTPASEAAASSVAPTVAAAGSESSLSGLGGASLSAYAGPAAMALLAITNAMNIMSAMDEEAKMNTPQMIFARNLATLRLEGAGQKQLYGFNPALPAEMVPGPIGSGGIAGHYGMDQEDLNQYLAGLEGTGKQFGVTKKQVLDYVSDALGPANQAMVTLAETIVRTKDALQEAGSAVAGNSSSMKDYTEDMEVLRSILASSLDPTKDLTDALKQSGDIATTTAGIIQFLADALGVGKDKAKELAEALGLIPKDLSTDYSINIHVNGGEGVPAGPSSLDWANPSPASPTSSGPSDNVYSNPTAVNPIWVGGAYHFGGIVKAHGGLRLDYRLPLAYDEVPIVAQAGERVLSRGGNDVFEKLLSRLGDMINNQAPVQRSGPGGPDTIQITVVTQEGKVLKEQTLRELKTRSKRGEVVIYANGVAA